MTEVNVLEELERNLMITKDFPIKAIAGNSEKNVIDLGNIPGLSKIHTKKVIS